ncbi:MAG: pyridoxine 5'-phosphate synthase [bacterium]
MARLSINVDCIAAFRQMLGEKEPDPVSMVMLAELGGVDGVVCSLNEKLHPVSERDIRLLKGVVKSHLNIRVTPTNKLVSMVISIAPDMVTVIPTDVFSTGKIGRLDIVSRFESLAGVIENLNSHGFVVNVMIPPQIQQLKEASKLNCDYVEFNLNMFNKTKDYEERAEQLENISSLCLAAEKLNLGVMVGSGLSYKNINDIINISAIEEVNIGQAIFTRAIAIGVEAAVRDMVALVH